jgi:mediator of RNA polymerase II transcription subunit 14
MLSTLQDMNVQLHIRLTLHEDLPHYLRNWKCANGRATFTFPGEFEFDVTISEEDPSVQLWFVDLRFLFNPSFIIPDGEFRVRLHAGADNALAQSGIPGCAQFLRNFVLTHQITVLRTQAATLMRGAWASVLKVDQIHRSLIVQYWLDSPFSKSWIELGISSGKSNKRLLPGRVELPRITTRWKRYGEDAPPNALDLQLTNLSMSSILRRATAIHGTHLLRTAHSALTSLAGPTSPLTLTLHHSTDEPADCSLSLRLGRHGTLVTFAIEPFSGRLTLQPATPLSQRAEAELNRRDATLRNPIAEVPGILERFVCIDIIGRIEVLAHLAGWEGIRDVRVSPDVLRATFGPAVRAAWFKPAAWQVASAEDDAGWCIALVVSLTGLRWWAVQLYEHPVTQDTTSTDERSRGNAAAGSSSSIPAAQFLPHVSARMAVAELDGGLLREVEDEAERGVVARRARAELRGLVFSEEEWEGDGVEEIVGGGGGGGGGGE